MAIGPGKYDDFATLVREATGASAVILIVIDGMLGAGMTVQATEDCVADLPKVLERAATIVRADIDAAPHTWRVN